jgi:hypothetical protein
MKLLKMIFLVSFVFAIILFSLSGLKSQNGSVNMQDRFYIGTFNFFFERNLRIPFQLAMYDSLRYNAMLSYSWHLDSIPNKLAVGKSFDAGFFDSLIYYKPFTDSVLADWTSVTGQPAPHSLLFEREKILRAVYGQRSTYQAESNPVSQIPKYFYNTHQTGRDSLDPVYNVTGRCCNKQAGDGAGYIVEELIEKGEQVNKSTLVDSNSNSSSESLISDVKKQNYKYKWFVKPCIRIDAQYAMGNRDSLVARIEIISKSGDIKALDLKCLNFLDNNFYYDGRYMEMFNRMDSAEINDYKLFAPALWLTNYTADDTTSYRGGSNYIDYRVYWYGKVNMWLDYVRVDDEWAHYLFTDSADVNPNNHWKFHSRIKEEVEAFGGNNALGYFWVDEFAYNNIPCLAEVNRLIKKYSNNRTAITTAYCTSCIMGMNGFVNLSWYGSQFDNDIHNYLKNSGAISGLMMNEMYPFYQDNPYPANLTITQQNIDNYPATKLYQKANSNAEYDSAISSAFNGWWTYL